MRTVADKVWDYLVEHTTPVSAERLAKRFIVSKSHVAAALRALQEKGILECIKVGNKHFYKIKD
jgi:predicted transcriptional regulator